MTPPSPEYCSMHFKGNYSSSHFHSLNCQIFLLKTIIIFKNHRSHIIVVVLFGLCFSFWISLYTTPYKSCFGCHFSLDLRFENQTWDQHPLASAEVVAEALMLCAMCGTLVHTSRCQRPLPLFFGGRFGEERRVATVSHWWLMFLCLCAAGPQGPERSGTVSSGWAVLLNGPDCFFFRPFSAEFCLGVQIASWP